MTRQSLPSPSILQKLENHISGAAIDIMARAETIAATRRAEENAALAARPSRSNTMRNILAGAGSVLCLWPAKARPSFTVAAVQRGPADEIRRDWIRVGDDLRVAITDYMREKNLKAQDIGLSAAEAADLSPLTSPAPRPS